MASFSKSVSARRKWIVTRIVLSELVSHIIEKQDRKRMQMTSSPIKRDNADLNKLITGIESVFLQTFEMKSSTTSHR